MSLPAGGPAGQVCCVCLYVREGVAPDAVTTIAGYSICEDHLGTITAGLGSPAGVCTRNSCWKDPRTPSAWR